MSKPKRGYTIYPNPKQEDYDYQLALAYKTRSVVILKRLLAWAKIFGVFDVSNIAARKLKRLAARKLKGVKT